MKDAERKKLGTQGLVLPVVKKIGTECPIGEEIQLVVGLQKIYPDLPHMPAAWNALMDGLASRFVTPPPEVEHAPQ